jgi:hypothetical protein
MLQLRVCYLGIQMLAAAGWYRAKAESGPAVIKLTVTCTDYQTYPRRRTLTKYAQSLGVWLNDICFVFVAT